MAIHTLKITPYPKQIEFFQSDAKRIAYGGARGGGKSWAARTKAILLALNYDGIQILLLRRTLKELEENHIFVLIKELQGLAEYKAQQKTFVFPNGSRIVCGYCKAEVDVLQYQGQAYDVIMMEEATQFTEFQYQALTESNRASGQIVYKDNQGRFSPRMYFTCNPGGVGHGWVKRLFVTRVHKSNEDSKDYKFIPSLVYDNKFLMEHDPGYVKTLEALPENRKKAMLYGDWNVFEGQYFPEFDPYKHVVEPFHIPYHWQLYRVFDYGLDCFACYIIAIDRWGTAYVVDEIHESNLIISAAARRALGVQNPNLEHLPDMTIAPPDMWSRSQETGKSKADIFAEHGLLITHEAKNARATGHLAIKEYLKDQLNEEGGESPRLYIFDTCKNLIQSITEIQASEKDPNDCATDPHDVTHAVDALRYFCVEFTRSGELPREKETDDWGDEVPDYEEQALNFMNYGT